MAYWLSHPACPALLGSALICFACSAEATDIANAVLDGVDGILLGAETYRGNYALECVNTGEWGRYSAAWGCLYRWQPALPSRPPACQLLFADSPWQPHRHTGYPSLTSNLPPPSPCPAAVVDICRAAEEVFDHANHFDHLHTESDYFLGSDEDPELPRHKLGRTISHASMGSDHGGASAGGYMGSMANLPR
jgi:hypothetical protein